MCSMASRHVHGDVDMLRHVQSDVDVFTEVRHLQRNTLWKIRLTHSKHDSVAVHVTVLEQPLTRSRLRDAGI